MRLSLVSSLDYQGPSEWQHNHLVYQPFLPVFYHLQSRWRCTLCHHPDHYRSCWWIKSGLAVTVASSLSNHGFIPSGSIDICMSSLFKCFLMWLSSTKSKSPLLQTFSQVSRAWDSWRTVLLIKTGEKSIEYLNHFHVTRSLNPLSSRPTVFLVFLLLLLYL